MCDDARRGCFAVSAAGLRACSCGHGRLYGCRGHCRQSDINAEPTTQPRANGLNTFCALLTQEEQVRCFRNVAQRLEDDGAFVIETFVPDVTRFDRGQRVSALRIRDVWLDAEMYDPVSQTVRAQHLVVGSQGPRWYPVRLSFAYPPELDLMAQLGGLRLRERWNNWKREPYTAMALQVSVYERGD
jgi:hypothetical protein